MAGRGEIPEGQWRGMGRGRARPIYLYSANPAPLRPPPRGAPATPPPPPLDSPNLAGPCQIHKDEPWNDEVRDRPDGGRDPPRAREFWAPKKDGLSSGLSLRARGGG